MLTDAKCRSAQPASKPYKLFDEKGLYLYVTATGFKSWRLKYYFRRKEKRLTFGAYPEVSLREARELRDEARRSVRQGADPGELRRSAMAVGTGAMTFKELAARWHEDQKSLWTQKHAANVWTSLDRDVFPVIGSTAVDEVKPSTIRELLKAVQDRGAIETAHNLRGRISKVYQLAIALELTEIDPAASMSAVLRPIRKRRMPAIEQLGPAREMLSEAEGIQAHPVTKLASRLLALTAARPGMIRFAERSEFEGLETADPLWRVPAAKMKQELQLKEDDAFEFVLPLAAQAADVVREALKLGGAAPWLFPSSRFSHRPMSENALNVFYRRVPKARGRHVPHGWRSSFSTIMNERALAQDRPGDRAVIDLMLAHRPKGVEAIYNRAAYMPRRRELAREWADILLEGFPPAASLLEGPRR